ncbi:MAG TPA: hypothetical protein VFY69_06090 [Solirubrobacterales bacterium]|nr:hypothetical protein [Solirubrobacterales bacterium]
MTDRRSTNLVAWAALVLALAAFVFSGAGGAIAAKVLPGPSLKPKKFGILRLNAKRKFPASVLPKSVFARCSPETVKIGTVCMMTNPYPLEKDEIGVNDYFFATQKCASLGGYLPTAAQLIGAAKRVKLAGRVDDNEVTASTDIDPTDGLKDRREMSATLTTTASGGRAAGSMGVSDVSRGDPKAGEPDPIPLPADPSPETLHYVTVYDNGNRGGFAGGKPVGQPENFRCAFNFTQGRAGELR